MYLLPVDPADFRRMQAVPFDESNRFFNRARKVFIDIGLINKPRCGQPLESGTTNNGIRKK